MLGIHIAVAIAWQHASSGNRTNYAAEVSRRRPNNDRHSESSIFDVARATDRAHAVDIALITDV